MGAWERAVSRSDPLLDEARRTTRSVARTFALACRLLPRSVRDDVYRLYLVFRTLDDLVDEDDPAAVDAVACVEEWARGGPAETREARILADLDVPRQPILDFCAGMRTDLDGAAIRTEADLETYCYRVAGTVGVVLARVLGTDGDGDAAAAALGCAMQRTNILRDVDEDRAAGRVYLPDLAAGEERATVIRRHVARADALYDEGIAGITHLRRGRVAIRAAAVMYREILRQIERDGYASGRATVSAPRKVLIAASAQLAGMGDGAGRGSIRGRRAARAPGGALPDR